MKEDTALFRTFSSLCFPVVSRLLPKNNKEPQLASGLMELFFFLKQNFQLSLIGTDRAFNIFFCFVQELESALPGLSERQGKAGSSDNDYAQNVALRYQEAVVRFQPR